VLEHRDHLPAFAAAILLIVDRHRRAHVLGHEGPHAVEPFLLLRRQIEIHGTLLVFPCELVLANLFCAGLSSHTARPASANARLADASEPVRAFANESRLRIDLPGLQTI